MGSMAPFLQKSLAGELPPGKKLLFIFLRGAMDAVQAVIPYGDQGRGSAKSYARARPNIGIDQDDAPSLNNFLIKRLSTLNSPKRQPEPT